MILNTVPSRTNHSHLIAANDERSRDNGNSRHAYSPLARIVIGVVHRPISHTSLGEQITGTEESAHANLRPSGRVNKPRDGHKEPFLSESLDSFHSFVDKRIGRAVKAASNEFSNDPRICLRYRKTSLLFPGLRLRIALPSNEAAAMTAEATQDAIAWLSIRNSTG